MKLNFEDFQPVEAVEASQTPGGGIQALLEASVSETSACTLSAKRLS